MNFSEFISNELGNPRTWVLARRTKLKIQRFGEDAVFITRKQYDELFKKFQDKFCSHTHVTCDTCSKKLASTETFI